MSTTENSSTETTYDGEALAEFYEDHDDLDDVRIADSAADVGRRMTEAMELAEHTTEDLAVRLGVPATTVASWQAGDEKPSGTMANRVAGILGSSLSWLLIGEGAEPRDTADPDARRQVRAALDEARAALRQAEEQLRRVAAQLAD